MYNKFMPPSTIRERILAYLDEQRLASAPQLAAALGVTRANIRYHLGALLKENSIEFLPDSASHRGPGRPELFYHLRHEARPDNFTNLANALLTVYMRDVQTKADAQAALRRLASALLELTPARSSLTRRLSTLVQFLNRWNYQARWEARAQAPHVLFRNCPYAAILPQHPELCQLDRLLIEQATGQATRQVAKVNLLTNQPPACVFSILAEPSQPSSP